MKAYIFQIKAVVYSKDLQKALKKLTPKLKGNKDVTFSDPEELGAVKATRLEAKHLAKKGWG